MKFARLVSWMHRHPDPDTEARSVAKAARADVLEEQASAVIAQARRSTRDVERVIRANHLAPKIAAALRENR